MKKSPESPNQRKSPDKRLRYSIKVRLAVGALLCVIAGGVLDRAITASAKNKKDGIAEIDKSRIGGKSGSDSQRTGHSSFLPVPSGSVCADLSDGDILNKAHNIETKQRLSLADKIIGDNCITNLEDRETIRSVVLQKGDTIKIGPDTIAPSPTGSWFFSLDGIPQKDISQDSDGGGLQKDTPKTSDGGEPEEVSAYEGPREFKLKEAPPAKCRPITDEERKAIEEYAKEKEKVKAMADMIRNGQAGQILAGIDLRRLEEAVRLEELEKGFGDALIKTVKEAKSKLKGKMSSGERTLLACRIISVMLSAENSEKVIRKNPYLNSVMEELSSLGEVIAELEKINDIEEFLPKCLDLIK